MRQTTFILAAALAVTLRAQAQQIPTFTQFDLDDDGLISEDEYVSHQTGTRRASESEAIAKFTKFDLDHNHTVTEDELYEAVYAGQSGSIETSVSAIDLANSQ
jgi:Ca2+-binding EF-hand superfamily protein